MIACVYQSAEAVNMVKQDLSEFVCTIQHDTSAVVADTANAVKDSLKVLEYMHGFNICFILQRAAVIINESTLIYWKLDPVRVRVTEKNIGIPQPP